MAQHDFVPAWLNFPTSQSSTKSSSTSEKHSDNFARGDGRFGVNRRRHNSSDGFFSNGLLRASGGRKDGCYQPSLLRHDSVDSGVSKGVQVSLVGSQVGKESAGWHNVTRGHDSINQRGGGSAHRHWNGSFHNRKSSGFQDKAPVEVKEERKEEKDEKLQFEEEDFPSLNPDAAKQPSQSRPVSTPAGVWENPPSAKQPVSKMLVIKKVLKEEPIFSTSFCSSGNHFANSNKNTASPSVYKNLIPKPAAPPTKPGPWKSTGRENKPGLLYSGQDSAFTSPVAVIKPSVQFSSSCHISPKETPSSITPPIEISTSRLMKLTRAKTDKKSEFLKALKDDRNDEISEHTEFDKLEGCVDNIPETKKNGNANGHQHSLSFCGPEKDYLSSSLEAEHRLLKAMGWQECSENDDNFLPLTEDELREFQAKTEQLKKNGFRKNGFQLKNRCTALHFAHWRGIFSTGLHEDSDSETSSSTNSDDDA
ncbi:vasculin-like protein 1 isoform X1 [Carcharodon carcharias]|uniref:vasculin-like protein 1 isoform X1 n=1 Tax=Carcharodon carcharias TaxID=13397 RepID=UPI001B7E9853|nr:vasculin-like protein 1 isoform X1 [Carcharodon carcharias]XP_041064474.1 vasculin-like protein 1 isoform X1 [Carcharodon carcharias]XP_041064475.1 vasculin-like protein 1 isoform X1 [Carcharodon carcharias]